jgi:hypothetical protein
VSEHHLTKIIKRVLKRNDFGASLLKNGICKNPAGKAKEKEIVWML